jgi:predicted nucleic acid-binding Zn ribbon protein
MKYRYKCKECSQEHELDQTIQEGEEYLKNNTCQSCGGGIYRVMQATSFVLQGAGWYTKGGY